MSLDTMEQPEPQDSATSTSNLGADNAHDHDQHHDDDLSDADPQGQAAEEEEEVEVGDHKLALPKSIAEKLKAERLMHADYTQKTQQVAEQRKQVEAQAEDVVRQRQEQHQYIQEVAKVVAIDDQLAQYQALDWQALIASDPVQAMQLQQQQKALEGARHNAIQAVTQKQQQVALNEQQAIAKQVQEASAYFEREIKGWSPERSNALLKFGTDAGIPAQVLSQAVLRHPALAKILHQAELYDQLSKKQTPKPPAVPAAKPAIRVGSNATVKKDPTKMNDTEFAAWRKSTSQRKK